jgi:hypothetical protein
VKKIIAVVLLLVGVGLIALGAYSYFFSGDQERCLRYRREAVEQFDQARAAEGTARGAALAEEARGTSAVADVACRNASQTRQNAMLMGLGGVVSIIASAVLLAVSRRRAA